MQDEQLFKMPRILIVTCAYQECQQSIREIQAGIEEEGIPYEVVIEQHGDAIELAYKGAQLSRLEVGVGVSDSGLCIHHGKLPAEQPLHVLNRLGTRRDCRLFGYNAARLVKGIPFKCATPENVDDEVPSELMEYVRQIVYKVLKDRIEPLRGE